VSVENRNVAFRCAGLVAGKPEHRLSGELPAEARAHHAAGSRSSDGSGNLWSEIGFLVLGSLTLWTIIWLYGSVA
jgi:hypothetical protein